MRFDVYIGIEGSRMCFILHHYTACSTKQATSNGLWHHNSAAKRRHCHVVRRRQGENKKKLTFLLKILEVWWPGMIWCLYVLIMHCQVGFCGNCANNDIHELNYAIFTQLRAITNWPTAATQSLPWLILSNPPFNSQEIPINPKGNWALPRPAPSDFFSGAPRVSSLFPARAFAPAPAP